MDICSNKQVATGTPFGSETESPDVARDNDSIRNLVTKQLSAWTQGMLDSTDSILAWDLDPMQKLRFERLTDATMGILTTVDNLFDVVELQSARKTLNVEPFNPRETLRDLIEPWEKAARGRGFRLVTHVGDSVPEHAAGDMMRFRKLVRAFVTGAIRWGNPPWFIEVEAHRSSDCVVTLELTLHFMRASTGVEPEDSSDPSAVMSRATAILETAAQRRLAQAMGGTLHPVEMNDLVLCHRLSLPLNEPARVQTHPITASSQTSKSR